MASGAPTPKIQVVDGDGVFQLESVEAFAAENKLAESKRNYQVVAIMGPQSSGKSTLLNHVFGTGFQMMDAMSGRSQTTKGIWLSKSPKLPEATTLVMDLEGSDGRERGEDDTNFERQSALFALAVADVLIVNIWCHDIGREHGSGKPLLKTIFQVNLKLFAPEPNRRRTVLLFVIRDKSKTPLAKLVEVMGQDLAKMWDSIAKPPQYEASKMNDFFEVQYAGLSHFEEKYEDFLADTVVLRRRFSVDVEDSLVRTTDDKLPGDVFCFSVKGIWDVIRSQKDLNLPAHKIMVANIRCREIADDQLRQFAADQAWTALQAEAAAGLVPSFGPRAHTLLDSCVHGYLEEALYFDNGVREEKQGELLDKLHALLRPLYAGQAKALHAAALAGFSRELKLALLDRPNAFADCAASCRAEALDTYHRAFAKDVAIEGTGWDGTDEGLDITAALDARVAAVKGERVQEALQRTERTMASVISGPVIGLLDTCPPNLWPKLHGVARDAAALGEKSLLEALAGFALGPDEEAALRESVAASARSRLDNHVREAALTRLSRMKDRFQEVFTLDEHKTPRMWTVKDDVPGVARQARLAAANVLAQLAVMRPDTGPGPPSSVGRMVGQAVLRLAQPDVPGAAGASSGGAGGSGGSTSGTPGSAGGFGNFSARCGSFSFGAASTPDGTAGGEAGEEQVDVQSAASWPGVDPELVLLQPHEVRTSWREFMSNSNISVQQALATQHANKMASSRPPPLWAVAAILFLGWNEFTALLWNPVWLLIGVGLVLFLRTLYRELDVDSEMQRGALPGTLAIAAKFAPAMQAVVKRSVAAGQAFVSTPQEFASSASAGGHHGHHQATPPLPGSQYATPLQDGAGGGGRAGDDGAAQQQPGTLNRRRGPADVPGGRTSEVEMSNRKDL